MALHIGNVHGYVWLMKEKCELQDIAIQHSRMQEIVALVILRQRVGTMRQKQLNDLQVTSFAGPEDGCGLGISSFRIDIGSRLNEKMAQRVMSVDSSPLGKMYTSVCYSRLFLLEIRSLRTCNAVIPCSSVDFALYLPLSNSFCIPRSSPSLANCIKSCSTGSCGGLESRSLSSTLSRPSFPGESVALPERRRSSGVVEGSREAMVDG